MPVMNLERVQKREAALRKTLADKGESMDDAKRRVYKKRLRRAQRKRRRLAAEAARLAAMAKPAKGSSGEAPAEEAKSE